MEKSLKDQMVVQLEEYKEILAKGQGNLVGQGHGNDKRLNRWTKIKWNIYFYNDNFFCHFCFSLTLLLIQFRFLVFTHSAYFLNFFHFFSFSSSFSFPFPFFFFFFYIFFSVFVYFSFSLLYLFLSLSIFLLLLLLLILL